MTERSQLLLLVVLPLAVVAAIVAATQLFLRPMVAQGYVMRIELPQTDNRLELPPVGGDEDWPLVVIDAGHGGYDPGASGQGFSEKKVVLGLALALRGALLERGGVRVAMTREDDSFRALDERFEIARRLDADLFISIHADSAGEASEVTGASIYTLSSEASSEAAARFAERENASDRINGQDIGGQNDVVSTILVELSQRRTQEQSAQFARLILREGKGVLAFHPRPIRSAALKVLRAPDVPSVLYESGFITNENDARRLTSAEGRKRFAEIMARAIRIYFARQNQS